ncbi:MAG: hypothetical protein IJ643_07955 [Eubacterium sp.]|nr:hypothetical protein [Eubacterium sp.]
MKQTIELEFNKSLTKLAGNPFGQDVYNQQVKDIINYESECIEIVLPERVDNIASSFIQGFFKSMVDEIGIKGIIDKITIISSIANVKEMIIEHLE